MLFIQGLFKCFLIVFCLKIINSELSQPDSFSINQPFLSKTLNFLNNYINKTTSIIRIESVRWHQIKPKSRIFT